MRFAVSTKVPIYARAGVVETWVVDIEASSVSVFRDPEANGYRTRFSVSGDDRVSALAMPGVGVAVSEFFPQ